MNLPVTPTGSDSTPYLNLALLLVGTAVGVVSHEVSHTVLKRRYDIPFSYCWHPGDSRLAQRGLFVPFLTHAPAVRTDCNPLRVPPRVARWSALAPGVLLLMLSGLVWGVAQIDAPAWLLLGLLGFWLAHVPSPQDLWVACRTDERFRLAMRAEWYRKHRAHRYAEGFPEPALGLPSDPDPPKVSRTWKTLGSVFRRHLAW